MASFYLAHTSVNHAFLNLSSNNYFFNKASGVPTDGIVAPIFLLLDVGSLALLIIISNKQCDSGSQGECDLHCVSIPLGYLLTSVLGAMLSFPFCAGDS